MSLNDRVMRDSMNPKYIARDKHDGKVFLVGRQFGERLAREGKIKILGDQEHGDNLKRFQDNN